MEPTRQKWTARIVLLAAVAAGLSWLGHLDLKRRISTDVLDLVPTGERSPELALLRNLASQEEARVILLAIKVPATLRESPETRAERGNRAATQFALALSQSLSIAQAIPLSDSRPKEALAAAIYSRRLDLLLPGWLEEHRRQFEATGGREGWSTWLAERTASDLETFLAKPEAMATQDIVTSDPLLLVRAWSAE